MIDQISENGKEMNTFSCPYCYLCSSAGQLLYKGIKDVTFGTKGSWNIKKCINPDCGMIWLDPMPTKSDISKAYENYYTHEKQIQIKNECYSSSPLLQKTYEFLLQLTKIKTFRDHREFMYIRDLLPGKLLEIGCGDGKRLTKIKSLGWEVTGQEIDPKAAITAQKKYALEIKIGHLQDINFDNHSFDAIIMEHVIEHVHDPINLLIECYRILKPKGTLVVLTPNNESLGHKYFTSTWRGLEPPRHLHIFSPKTLGKIAREVGFAEFFTWTTSIKAGAITRESFDIISNKNHTLKLNAEVKAAIFQTCSVISNLLVKTSGEECILKAKKP